VSAVIEGLVRADKLPGANDVRSTFAPGHAHVRRVSKHNLWIWYRFDADHVTLLALKDEPPVPLDDE
jgi:hypothetical protein